MSLNLGVVNAAVALDDSDYRKKMSDLPNQAESTFKKIGALAAGYLTIRGVFSFASEAMREFSKLEEGNNKLKYTYTEIREEAKQTAEVIAKTFGLSDQTATNAIADIGDLLTGFGFKQRDALNIARQVTERGIDVASFKGLDQTETIRKMTVALTGETESLKSMGIVVQQGTEGFRQMVKDIMATTGATELQAKAQVILAEIMKQTKNAAGDYLRPDAARTYAQEITDLNEAVKRFKAQVGTDIQPITQESVVRARELLQWYNELTPSARALANSTVAASVAFLALQKTGVLSKANAAVSGAVSGVASVFGGFSGAREAAEVQQTVAAENLKRAEYAKTDAFREARAQAQSVRIARLQIQEAQAAIATAQTQLAAANASGDQSQILAAKRQLAVASQNLTKAQLAESTATQGLTAKHAAAKTANLQHTAATNANALAQKTAAASATTHGAALATLRAKLNAASVSARAFMASIGPVGWMMLAAGAGYAWYAYKVGEYTDQIEGAIGTSEKAAEAAKALAKANREARSSDNSAMSRLQELARYESLNNAEKREAEGLIKQLVERYGKLGIEIDAVSGKLIIGAKAFKEISDAQAKEYGKDLSRQMGATMSEIASLQNGASMELGNWFKNSVFNQRAADFASFMAGALGFNDREKKRIESNRFSALQHELAAAMELKTTEEKISKLEGIRNKLVSDNDKERAAAVEKLIKKLKEMQTLEKKLADFQKNRKPDENPGVSGKTPKEISEERIKALESYKNAKWDMDYNEAADDPAKQLGMLGKKLEELNKKKGDTIKRDTPENELTKEQLDLLKEIYEVESKIRKLKKDGGKSIEEEKKSYADILANRKKQNEQKAVEIEIKNAEDTGDRRKVNAILQREYAKAKELAGKLQAGYETAVREAEADGLITDAEKKRIDDARKKMQDAFDDESKWKGKVDEFNRTDKDAQKSTVAFSSEVLTAMLGDKTPEQETAKNTKEMVRLARKTNENLEKNSGGEVLG